MAREIRRSAHVNIAKIIRNSEVPEPWRSLILRDLCTFFYIDNPEFDQKRFLFIAHGGIMKDDASKKWKNFDVMKYLDEVYNE